MSRLTAMLLGVTLLALPAQARAQALSSGGQQTSSDARVVWTLIGGGIGFGAGLLVGLSLFDDAVYAERKIWTTALASAAAGGVAGNLLSRRPDVPPDVPAGDPLWNGMALGAGVGAVVGLWYIPEANCKPDINPECPRILRISAGIPAVASGAAIGALVDRIFTSTAPRPASHRRSARTVVVPVVGPGAIGIVFSRSFE